MDELITYRRAVGSDAQSTYDVFLACVNDQRRKRAREVHAQPETLRSRALAFRRNALEHDRDRFWIAEASSRTVGYGLATLRDDVWYLASLHVLPAYQSHKIGSELIRRSLAGTGPKSVLAVLTDAMSLTSNGLYMRLGMLPQDAMLTFAGPLNASHDSHDDAAIRSRAIRLPDDLASLDVVDLASIGFARRADHGFWMSVPGLQGLIIERGRSIVGYAYVAADGGIGPLGVSRPEELPPVLDHTTRVAREAGATALSLRIPGSARLALAWANRRQLRLAGIGLMLSTRAVGQLDRYVTSVGDSLY